MQLFYFSLVAKRKSLFDDKPVEIQELTYIIKQVSDVYNKTGKILHLICAKYIVLNACRRKIKNSDKLG